MIRRATATIVLLLPLLTACGGGSGGRAPDSLFPSLALRPGETFEPGTCTVRAAPAVEVEPAGADFDVPLPPRPDTDIAALSARFQTLEENWRSAGNDARAALAADSGESETATAVAVSRWEAAFLALAEVETVLLQLRRSYASDTAFESAQPDAAALLARMRDIRAQHMQRYEGAPALAAAAPGVAAWAPQRGKQGIDANVASCSG